MRLATAYVFTPLIFGLPTAKHETYALTVWHSLMNSVLD